MRRPENAIRTTLLLMLSLVAGALAALAPAASAASYSPSSYAARLLSLVNGARANAGLSALQLASGTTTVAAGWTSTMADGRTLSHNPNLRDQLEAHGSPDWGTYGENVGQGSADDPDDLFDAYMRSPEHRDNILTGAYRYVGVAVVYTGSTAWNTFDFVDRYGTPTPARQPAHHRVVRHARTPKPQARPAASPVPPTAAAAADRPASAPSARQQAAVRPDHRSAQPSARHRAAQHAAALRHHADHATAARHRAHVQGLRMTAKRPAHGVLAAEPSAVSPLSPLPANRSSRAVLVAVAVLALVAAARRWTLVVARV